MYVYEAMADAIAQEGVGHVFAVLAEDNMELMIELQDKKDVKIISTRKESGAAAMADGYARVTGKPGVCSVTVGPGLTNAATSLMTARRHRSPVICLTTEINSFDSKVFKGGLDQRRFAEAIAEKYIQVYHAEALAEGIHLAFRHVRSGGGPVVLAVPREIMKSVLDMDWEYSPTEVMMPAQQRIYPNPELIAKAVDILRVAERPVILVGRGVSGSHAEQEIISLAERTGALIATTLLAKGYLADHPRNVGIAGPFASKEIHAILSQSDCVIAVGCSLNNDTTEYGLLFAEAQIIHIDQDPAAIGAFITPAVGIIGDARASLTALNVEIDRQRFDRKGDVWRDDIESFVSSSRSALPSPYAVAPDAIDPRQLIAELDKMLPRERIVVTDSGHAVCFVADKLSVPHPSQFVWTPDFGSVGMGLYQGVGAAVGRPDKHVVVFTGDGGFMMGLEELDTAVRYQVPITVVVMNDGAFGIEVHLLEAEKKPIDLALFNNPDFAAVATALGAVGLTVRNTEDLRAAAVEVAKKNWPVLIDAKVNPHIVHEVLQEVAGRYLVTRQDGQNS
ncbi:MAG: thiamine pyrophosphate-binding protein [Chloroflexi bacterium]|nr:thiamine pyrophosphate-binding protein [Chloroflexota bacterium]